MFVRPRLMKVAVKSRFTFRTRASNNTSTIVYCLSCLLFNRLAYQSQIITIKLVQVFPLQYF